MPFISPDLPEVEVAIVASTNAARGAARVGPLVVDSALRAVARAYAAKLATTRLFSHVVDGTASERVRAGGYDACGIGENLAMRRNGEGFATGVLARSTVDGWLASPVHKGNMLAGAMTQVGVGVAQAPGLDGTFIVVQVLARPKSQAAKVRIVNASNQTVSVGLDGSERALPPRATLRLQSCGAGGVSFSGALTAHYVARHGAIYTVRGDGAALRVEITTDPTATSAGPGR